MSSQRIALAALVHADDQGAEGLVAAVADSLAARGVAVAGLVQRDSPNEIPGAHRHMDLIDVGNGTAYRISQNLGSGSDACCLDPGALLNAGQVLRRAIDSRPELIVVNRFGGLEANGEGFAEEILEIVSQGIPLLTLVADRHKAAWQSFSGGCGLVLPPSVDAATRWFEGIAGLAGNRSAEPSSVLADTIATVTRLLGGDISDIIVERAVIGRFYTGVKLSNGSGGACFTPAKPVITSANCRSLPKAIGLAGRCRGRSVTDFLSCICDDQDACRALGIAVLNALADTCWKCHPHAGWRLDTGVDALTAARIRPGEHVVLVGAFVSYVEKLKQSGQRFTVLELDPCALTADEMAFYRPADDAGQVLPDADVLIMTGSTLLNDTIDDVLAQVSPEARVLAVGPSVPLLPDVLADRGADLLATIRITDPDHFLDVLAEGGGTQGTYDGSAELVVLRRHD